MCQESYDPLWPSQNWTPPWGGLLEISFPARFLGVSRCLSWLGPQTGCLEGLVKSFIMPLNFVKDCLSWGWTKAWACQRPVGQSDQRQIIRWWKMVCGGAFIVIDWLALSCIATFWIALFRHWLESTNLAEPAMFTSLQGPYPGAIEWPSYSWQFRQDLRFSLSNVKLNDNKKESGII